MFAVNVEKIKLTSTSEIVQISRSVCGKFLAIITRNCLIIKNLISKDFDQISNFLRDDDSMSKYGYNHWLEWMNNSFLAVGTQAGHIFIFSLSEEGKIISHSSFHFPHFITTHSACYSALVLAQTGPLLSFISPDGEVRSTITFDVEVPSIIRHIDISENIASFTFSDGSICLCSFKQGDIIKQQKLKPIFLPMKDVAQTLICRDFLILQTYNESIIRTTLSLDKEKQSNELTFISENASIFQSLRDCSNIITLASNGILSIWNSKTMKQSKTCIDLESLDIKEQDFIASEIDSNGLRLFCTTIDKIICINFAQTDQRLPSELFHTCNSIINAETGQVISVSVDFLQTGYPLSYVAIHPETDTYVVAGRKNFAMRTVDQVWHILNTNNNFCRSLWYQNGYFIDIVFDSEDPQYKIELRSKETLKILDYDVLNSVFLAIDHNTSKDKFVIVMQHSVAIYQILDSKLNLYKYYEVKDQQLTTGTLLQDEQSVAVVTRDDQTLKILPTNEIICEGVSSVFASPNSNLLFILAHGHQFVRSFNTLIRLDSTIPALFSCGFYTYNIKQEYKLGNLKIFDKTLFFHSVLIHWLNEPQKFAQIVKGIKNSDGLIDSMTKTVIKALESNRYEKLKDIFDILSEPKDHFLIAALFSVEPKWRKSIASLMSPKDKLKAKFPDLSENIEAIFADI